MNSTDTQTNIAADSGDGVERSNANRQEQREQMRQVWRTPGGWRYWSAINNSEVGVWYLVTAFVFFLFAGVLALIMRVQLAVPGNEIVSPELYNQLMTLHGSAMMFLFAVPVLEAVAIQLLPDMLAARDLPFPRLSAFGYWAFLIGGVFVCGSIFFGAAPAGGWFMYPPLTTDTSQSGIGADIWLLGLSFIEVASIAAAVEMIVGVLKCRPPGMRLHLMPPYAWYILVVGAMILFAFPPLIAGDLLFEMQRAFDWPFFDAERGGDPLLWQHLFWIFGHPEVYIIFLPSVALLTMIIPTFCRTPLVGYRWVVLASIGTGFLSFGLWAHHMFTTGLPSISVGIFSAASEMVAIPTAIQIFALLGTVWVGRLTRSVPMLFAVGALAIFVLGGLTGVMVAIAPFDWQAHDTYFIVAHLHYVLFGGMVFPLFAGLYYYYPKITGRLLSDRLGKAVFWLMFAGFNIAFLPMHLTGLAGMPRRVFTYSEFLGFNDLNLVSTIGAFILAAGIAVLVFDVLRPRRFKRAAGDNPWGAGTMEWLADDSGVPWGVRSIPIISSRYPLWDQPDLPARIARGDFYLPDAPGGDRETLVTSVIDAEPLQALKLGGPSWMPLMTAVALSGVFIFATYHLVWAVAVSALLTLACVLYWLWSGTAAIPVLPRRDIGRNEIVPVYVSGPRACGWWGMFITMLGDATAFISLIFAYFFLWTVNTAFPPAGSALPSVPLLATAALTGLLAWWATRTALRDNAAGNARAARLRLAAGALACVASIATLITSLSSSGVEPTAHAYDAAVWVIVVWTVAHLSVGIVMQLFCLAASLAGKLDAVHDAYLQNVTLYMHFLLFTVLISCLVISLAGWAT